jgi:KUP system potassium uptake protein
LGVVYGDIGSSPVYALRECFSHLYGLTPTPANVKVMPTRTSYFLGRERLLPHGTSPMARWRKRVFVLMSRNARSATEFFGLPSNRIVALAAQIEF